MSPRVEAGKQEADSGCCPARRAAGDRALEEGAGTAERVRNGMRTNRRGYIGGGLEIWFVADPWP